MDTLGCTEGWLLLFDRRATVSWEEKLFWNTETHEGNTIHIVGCSPGSGKLAFIPAT